MVESDIFEVIKTIYPVILLIIGFGTIWTLLTKRMKNDIESKVDQKDFDNLKEKVKDHDDALEKLDDLNRDTNNKVTQIWEFLATWNCKK